MEIRTFENLKAFHFEIGGYPDGTTHIDFERVPDGWRVSTGGNRADSSLRLLADDEALRFAEAIGASKVFSWRSGYLDSSVLDGTQWGVDASFEGSDTKFHSGGSNRWPEGFNALLKGLIALGLPEEYHDYENDQRNVADDEVM